MTFAPTRSRGAFPSAPTLLGGTALFIWIVAFVILTRQYFMDDAYIGFTYARNALAGYGYVFHPTAIPVEGTTNTGWIALLISAGYTGIDIPTASKLIGAGFLFAAVLLWTQHNAKFLPSHPFWLRWAPTLLTVTSVEVMYFSVSGMETAGLLLLLAAFVAVCATRGVSWVLAPLSTVAFTVRPESVGVICVFLLLMVLRRPAARKPAFLVAGLTGVLIAVVSVVRYSYFGAWLPNTFAAKPSSIATWTSNVWDATVSASNAVLPLPWMLPLLAVVAVGGWTVFRRHPSAGAAVVAVAVTGVGFALYARPDWTGTARYLAPYLPAVFLLFTVGLWRIARSLPKRRETMVGVVLLGFTIAQAVSMVWALTPERMATYPGYVMGSELLKDPAIEIGRLVPPDAVIASRRIGALSYFAPQQVFDYKFGLTDRGVADLIQSTGAPPVTATDEALSALWTAVSPECIVEDSRVLNGLPRQPEDAPQEVYAIHGADYVTVRVFPLGEDGWVLACRPDADVKGSAG